jgi:hypothetical protein
MGEGPRERPDHLEAHGRERSPRTGVGRDADSNIILRNSSKSCAIGGSAGLVADSRPVIRVSGCVVASHA